MAHTPSKSGQTLIFMALVTVMIAFAALFYFDVNKILHVKAVSRNAGDAAALAGARWQAITLNLAGSLNLAQALAITNDLSAGLPDSPDGDAIADLRQRLLFAGPLFGFLASQQAAKNNGIFNQDEFEREIRDHITRVSDEYVRFFPEPFEAIPPFGNAWEEYADMLSLIEQHGVAVNAGWSYFRHYANSNHLLLDPAFYDAIAGRSWCWFFYNAYDELRDYRSWLDWDDLPPIEVDPPTNSEIFSLRLERVRVRDHIPTLPAGSDWAATFDNLRAAFDGLEARDATDGTSHLRDFDATWAWYGPGWSSWSGHIPENFPWDGDLRPRYNYGGADAAIVVRAVTERHTDFRGADTVDWTAGAKPFGHLGDQTPPTAYGLVLPAFSAVRLVPIDTTLSGGSGQLRPGWLEFILTLLPQYMAYGPSVLPPGNWYAQQLLAWENPAFRQAGLEWLLDYSDSCDSPPPGPGGGGSGGSYHGH